MKLVRSLSLLLALVLLAGCATRHHAAPVLKTRDGGLKQTVYQAELTTHDGVLLRFTVFQPALAPGASAPLLLQTHPFGFWRLSGPHTPIAHALTSGEVVRRAWNAGYWVISFDQRGHGETGDHMTIANPEREGRDVMRIIDWAEANLALARNAEGDPYIGMVGESYGAGIQFVASALDRRIDALVPLAGWYDLERVLAPNDVPKSGWLTFLVLAGNTIAKLDKKLNEAYFHSRSGVIDPWVRTDYGGNAMVAFCRRNSPPSADALIIQGFRDVLFPVNEALSMQACLRSAGRDARLIAIDDGHLLPGVQLSPGWLIGWNVQKKLHCNGREEKTAEVIHAWLEAKLRGREDQLARVPEFCLTGDVAVDSKGTPPPRQRFAVNAARVKSGASGRIEWLIKPFDHVGNWFVRADGPDAEGLPPVEDGWLRPARIPLLRVHEPTWLVGMPKARFTVDESPQHSPILFAQLAVRRPGSGSYRVLNDQVTPLRGSGELVTDLSAVRARLAPGEVVGLIVRAYQNQYRFSNSGWRTAARIKGEVELPLAAMAPEARSQLARE